MTYIPKDLEQKLTSTAAEINPRFQQQLRTSLFKEDTMSNSTKFKRALHYVSTAPALAVFAAIIIVGSASAFVATEQANTARDTEIAVPSNLEGLLSFDDVKAIAMKDMPDVAISAIELEKEDGQMVFKVKFANGNVRLYDAMTGAPVMKDDELEDEDVQATLHATISAAEARSIAMMHHSGTITRIELETEDGVTVFSVRFADGGRVDVNAMDGSVMRVRGADDDNDGNSGPSSNSGSDDSAMSEDRSGSGSGSGSGSNSGSGSSGSGRSGSDDSGHSGSDD